MLEKCARVNYGSRHFTTRVLAIKASSRKQLIKTLLPSSYHFASQSHFQSRVPFAQKKDRVLWSQLLLRLHRKSFPIVFFIIIILFV